MAPRAPHAKTNQNRANQEMINLYKWAARHGVGALALSELHHLMGTVADGTPAPAVTIGNGTNEATVQSRIRLEAAALGGRLWRNNVGCLQDLRGVPVRYGLCNESKQVNQVIKSSDLIGCMPYQVREADIGCTLGIFTAREVKREGWTYSGTKREVAQLNYIKLVLSLGGDAGFVTGAGSL